MNTRIYYALTIVFCTMCSFTKAEDEVWPIMRMASDENNLYLATEEHGLVIVDKETGKQTFFNEDNGKIRHNHLRDVQVNGNMLALAGGYTRDGYAIHFLWNDWVELLDLEAGSSVTIHVDENELSDCYAPKYQLSKWPLSTGNGYWPRVFFDQNHEHCLWYTVYDTWAVLYDYQNEKVEYISYPLTSETIYSFSREMISDFRYDQDGALWISGGVLQDDKGDWRGYLYKLTDEIAHENEYGAESYFYNKEGTRVVPETSSCMAIDGKGNIWYARTGYEDEVYKFDGNDQWQLVFDGNDIGLKDEGNTYYYIRDLETDASGNVWLLTENMLYRITDHDELVECPCPYETGNKRSILIDGDIVYMATDKGLFKYEDEEFSMIKVPSAADTGIREVNEGGGTATCRVYRADGVQVASPQKGVSIFKPTKGKAKKYI